MKNDKIKIGYLCGVCGKILRESATKKHYDKCVGYTLTAIKWNEKYFLHI